MPRNFIDIKGQRFGQLTAQNFLGNGVWKCLCDCGNVCEAQGGALRFGTRISCGCKAPRNDRHGMSDTITHKSWTQMRRRCTDPNHANYKWYGGRGISFDPRWKDFVVFLEDMGECPDRNHTLDRIDPDKDYTKDNCAWRPLKDSVRRSTPIVQGMSIKAYAQANGLKYHTAYARWRAGTLT